MDIEFTWHTSQKWRDNSRTDLKKEYQSDVDLVANTNTKSSIDSVK